VPHGHREEMERKRDIMSPRGLSHLRASLLPPHKVGHLSLISMQYGRMEAYQNMMFIEQQRMKESVMCRFVGPRPSFGVSDEAIYGNN
jgi:hypothetical protein